MKIILGTLAFIGIYAVAEWLGNIMPEWLGATLFVALMFVSLRALFRLMVGTK